MTAVRQAGTDRRAAQPLSQTQRAVAMLREMIVRNRLLPGSDHLESELGQMLGMSRTPVREAALVLEGQGLLQVRPRRGVHILPISPADMEEIYSILTELESLAAHTVAQRGLGHAELAVLRQHLERMEAALAEDDRPAWAEADDAFHRALVALAGNRRLESIVATYSGQVNRARLLTLHMRPAPHKSNADHRALVEAIAASDADRARAVHRAHRLEAKEMMLALIAAHGFSAV
ncbi:MAG: GntR family transcriptional regulator [Sneathiellaceae bacterium]